MTTNSYPLSFAMPLQFKESMRDSLCSRERSAYKSWRNRFEGKTVYLIGWCECAFAVVDRLGDYGFEYISGTPDFLFDAAMSAAHAQPKDTTDTTKGQA